MPDEPEKKDRDLTGAQALIRFLQSAGVDTIFGYPGGANLPIYDELANSGITHVLSRHEQGAVHMADGFARVSGRSGVCLATSGPGATNLVTGLATAMMDSIPLVALTGQIPRTHIGTDSFQEVDCINITMPVTKHNELIFHEKDLVPALQTAFHVANTGRKGPVLLDFPKDVLLKEYPHSFSDPLRLPGYNPTTEAKVKPLKWMLSLLTKAKRPIILFGGGIVSAGAVPEFLQFVRSLQIPVVRTLMGTGVIPEQDPLYIGMIGTHGNRTANRIVHEEADVLFAVGTRMGDRSTIDASLFAKNAKVIHLDIDPAETGKNIATKVKIVGDIKKSLLIMNREIAEKKLGFEEPWTTETKRTTLLSTKDSAEILAVIYGELSKIDRKLHISTDVGRHQMWASHYCTNPKHLPLITSGGLGTMGFGLPAAIGAWHADPKTPVVCLSGDGSFMMTMQEFAVAVERRVPITVCILNDYRLTMIRELQASAYDCRYTTHDFSKNMNFPKLAEAMGGVGIRIDKRKAIGPTLRKVISSRVPTLIDFDLERISQSS